MKRKFVHVYQCKQGDTLAYDVYDNAGYLVVAKNTIIDEQVIKRLITFRVRQLSVYESSNTESIVNNDHVLRGTKKLRLMEGPLCLEIGNW